ncbi:MAG: hypothetical protein AAB225_15955 [Acidobacteriota bacterium]
MVVTIRLRVGPALGRKLSRRRELALTLSGLLRPAALAAVALAVWRLATDLKVTASFAVSRGLFSHWQVWTVMAVLLAGCAWRLARYGRGGGEAMP